MVVSARTHHFSVNGATFKPLTDVVEGHLVSTSMEFGGQQPTSSRLTAVAVNSADRQVYNVNVHKVHYPCA